MRISCTINEKKKYNYATEARYWREKIRGTKIDRISIQYTYV